MGVHRVELRAHCSGIDDLAAIRKGLEGIVGTDIDIQEKQDRSWHGAEQTNLMIELRRKNKAKLVLSKLGNNVLESLLNDDLVKRIDDRNVLHLRINLAELCCGNIVISEPRKREPCVKIRIKLEVYPGQTAEEIGKSCIQEALQSYDP